MELRKGWTGSRIGTLLWKNNMLLNRCVLFFFLYIRVTNINRGFMSMKTFPMNRYHVSVLGDVHHYTYTKTIHRPSPSYISRSHYYHKTTKSPLSRRNQMNMAFIANILVHYHLIHQTTLRHSLICAIPHPSSTHQHQTILPGGLV
jgi:hypothetical protein